MAVVAPTASTSGRLVGIDRAGSTDALTDGLLMLRAMFGAVVDCE